MRSVSKKLTGSIVLLFLGFVLFLAIKSFSSSQANKSAYPGPVDVQATQVNKLAYPGPVDIQATQVDKPAYPGPVDIQATPLSPEALCERWFSFRQAFSAEKRAMLEEDYKNCVNARLTPSPAGVDKLIDSTPPVGEYTVAEVKRVAGSGTILERSFSMLNSAYFTVKNMWKADLDGEHITVYAGGRRTNVSAAELVSNDLAWLGALVIIMTDQDGNPIPGRGEEYLTPVNAGAVRIVDAAGTTLNLAAKDGTSFAFDVANR